MNPVSGSSRDVAAVDPKWQWHYRTLLRLRDNLLRAQAEHEAEATATPETHSVDAAEIAEEQSEHDIILAELHSAADRLAEVNAALQRVRAGTYGTCEETGEPIGAARLRAIPWTRYSRSAAERHEPPRRPGHG